MNQDHGRKFDWKPSWSAATNNFRRSTYRMRTLSLLFNHVVSIQLQTAASIINGNSLLQRGIRMTTACRSYTHYEQAIENDDSLWWISSYKSLVCENTLCKLRRHFKTLILAFYLTNSIVYCATCNHCTIQYETIIF